MAMGMRLLTLSPLICTDLLVSLADIISRTHNHRHHYKLWARGQSYSLPCCPILSTVSFGPLPPAEPHPVSVLPTGGQRRNSALAEARSSATLDG